MNKKLLLGGLALAGLAGVAYVATRPKAEPTPAAFEPGASAPAQEGFLDSLGSFFGKLTAPTAPAAAPLGLASTLAETAPPAPAPVPLTAAEKYRADAAAADELKDAKADVKADRAARKLGYANDAARQAAEKAKRDQAAADLAAANKAKADAAAAKAKAAADKKAAEQARKDAAAERKRQEREDAAAARNRPQLLIFKPVTAPTAPATTTTTTPVLTATVNL